MKKAKIFLSAIIIMALAGGFLAFKARKFTIMTLATCNVAQQKCNNQVYANYAIGNVGNYTITVLGTLALNVSGKPCAGNCNNTIYLTGGE